MIELLQDLWVYFEPIHELLLAVSIALIITYVRWLFRAKVEIIWGSTSLSYHNFKLTEDGAPIAVSTEKLYVQNVGKKPASNIELILTDIPTSYTLWSPRDHQSKAMAGGGFSITVPSLASSELLIVDVIDIDSRNPKLLSVNCPDAIPKVVQYEAQRQFGKYLEAIAAFLMFVGLIACIYVVLKLTIGG